jgi:hypothetical protein
MQLFRQPEAAAEFAPATASPARDTFTYRADARSRLTGLGEAFAPRERSRLRLRTPPRSCNARAGPKP